MTPPGAQTLTPTPAAATPMSRNTKIALGVGALAAIYFLTRR